MKVLHLFNELRFSGAELLLYSASSQFLETDEHTILSTGDQLGEFATKLRAQGYLLRHLPFRKSPGFFWSLFWLFLHEGSDVVHVHAERGAFWTCLTARAAGRACVRTIHNEFLFEGQLRRLRAVERQILVMAGVRLVACSPRVARNEKAQFGIEPSVIENWIDPSRVYRTNAERRQVARRKFTIPDDAFVMISIGNYGPAKNQEAIIDALQFFPPTVSIFYQHCGSGAEPLLARMDKQSASRIRLLGPVSDIADRLAASDAFVSTSFFEGGQVSLLEAAAAGIPCITTRVGLAEVFDGCAGVSFIDPTAESLAEAIRVLAAKPISARLNDGQALSELVLERFVPEVGATKYVALYREALKRADRAFQRSAEVGS